MKPYYNDGQIIIYHGDCQEILPSLEPVDLVLTDPPYGIGLENHGRNDFKRRDVAWAIQNDHDTTVGQAVITYLLETRIPLIAFASPEHPWQGHWRSLLVWWKYGLGMGGDPYVCWKRDWELVQVANNGKLTGSRESAILKGFDMRPAEFEYHPTQKPVSLLKHLMLKVSGDTILDPFMGSGTTLRAAKDLGRKAIGIEIEERYCEVAVKRLAQEVLPLGFT